MSAGSSRLFSFSHLTFDSLGQPQGEARRKDGSTFRGPLWSACSASHHELWRLQRQLCWLRGAGRAACCFAVWSSSSGSCLRSACGVQFRCARRLGQFRCGAAPPGIRAAGVFHCFWRRRRLWGVRSRCCCTRGANCLRRPRSCSGRRVEWVRATRRSTRVGGGGRLRGGTSGDGARHSPLPKHTLSRSPFPLPDGQTAYTNRCPRSFVAAW